jgi:hypothetical protein
MTMKALKSPNLWVGIASIAALAGIGCVVTGLLTSNRSWTTVGLWLLAPLILGGVVLVVVVIPMLIRANRRKPPPTPDSPPQAPRG